MPTGPQARQVERAIAPPRERLIAAMAELVAKRGYRDTSMEMVCKRARVSHHTFQELFESKEEVYAATFDHAVELAARRLGEVCAQDARPWQEQIRACLAALLELIEAEPSLARTCLVEVRAAGQVALRRYDDAMERLLPKLRRGRELNPHSAGLAPRIEEAVIGGAAWLVSQRLAAGQIDDLDALLAELVVIVLTPYLGVSGAESAARSADGAGPS